MKDHSEMIYSHVERISEIETISRNNSKRIDNMERIVEAVYEMNGNIKVIAEQSKQQQVEIMKVVECVENQEHRLTNSENKRQREDSILLNRIMWLLISLILTSVFYALINYYNFGGT